MGGEQWMHARSWTKIPGFVSRTFTIVGNCCFPLYIPREKAEEWFSISHLINEQRMARNEWSFSGPSTEQEAGLPTLALSQTVAERNRARSCRRFLRERFLNSQADIP